VNRLELAQVMGLSVRVTNMQRGWSGQRMAVFTCRCKRLSAFLPLQGPLVEDGRLLPVVGCECLPPLREVFTPAELRGILQALSFEELLDLRDAVQKKNPRQGSTDEGSTDGAEKESIQNKDSAAQVGPQSRIGNELQCARHADCSGHDEPEGAA
jgi:hypothetical protein